MKSHLSALVLCSILTAGFANLAASQTTDATDPGHPRVNQAEGRIDNQENRVNAGVSNGSISANQATRDDAKINREQTSLNRDEAKDGGHITKGEQKNLNKRLNKGSKRIHKQRATTN